MDGLLSNPSPGTRSSNAVGSHIEVNVHSSLTSTRNKRASTQSKEVCGSVRRTLGNDHGVTRSHVRTHSRQRRRRRRRLESPETTRSDEKRIPSKAARVRLRINDPSGLYFKGAPCDVDGWMVYARARTSVYDKARESPRYPKLNFAAGARCS